MSMISASMAERFCIIIIVTACAHYIGDYAGRLIREWKDHRDKQ